MGFLACQIEQLEGDFLKLHHLRALVLGGKNGLLARHLPALANDDDGKWSLTAQELLKFENAANPENACILFELTPRSGEQKSYLLTVDVSGSTMSLVTDALFHFKVLALIEGNTGGAPDCFVVKNWRNGADRYEQMRLDGGFVGGNWAWSQPPLAVEATILHPLSS